MSLHEAIEQEDMDMIHVLLDSGRDVNRREEEKVPNLAAPDPTYCLNAARSIEICIRLSAY